MSFLSLRRVLCACVVSAASVAALAAPGTASATDLSQQCSGSNIKGLGSTFQQPAEEVWLDNFNASTDTNVFGCAGNPGQGSLGKPTVSYEQGTGQTGSGACLKAFGAGEAGKYNIYGFCGTDEAPTVAKEEEMEKNKAGGASGEKGIETIPTAQGAVAVIIHLPEGCVAQSTVTVGTKKYILGRLALDNATVEHIFDGTVTNWKQVEEAQTDDSAKITCTGGTAEEETPINVVVRLDKSGTTHIFKSYLAQVNTGKIEMEAFNEPEAGKGQPCKASLPEEEKTWKQVQEGCENQRWPTAAKVVRPAKSGNPAVIQEVNAKASSIAYADLAVARKEGFFSKKGLGGENKKGTETKVGEQNHRFWAEVQDSATAGTSYADPASNGDIEKLGNSNCAGTVYASEPGEKFPPKSTRETWFAVKAELVQKKYNICGLTYELALREYKPYLEPLGFSEAEGKAEATTVENYLFYAINSKAQGGGTLLKNHDYEKLSGTVLKEAETGLKEIGYAVP